MERCGWWSRLPEPGAKPGDPSHLERDGFPVYQGTPWPYPKNQVASTKNDTPTPTKNPATSPTKNGRACWYA